VHAAVTAPPGARPQDTADTHRYLVIPPYSLVKPYVKAYFTYFREALGVRVLTGQTSSHRSFTSQRSALKSPVHWRFKTNPATLYCST
jgi:hypothetical protein